MLISYGSSYVCSSDLGGKSYADSPFNRATQARRQPGSTFKLFVYLSALRYGMTPDTLVADEPITIADWSPKNDNGKYRGDIPLRKIGRASCRERVCQYV